MFESIIVYESGREYYCYYRRWFEVVVFFDCNAAVAGCLLCKELKKQKLSHPVTWRYIGYPIPVLSFMGILPTLPATSFTKIILRTMGFPLLLLSFDT